MLLTDGQRAHLLVELKACGKSRDLQKGKQLHAAVIYCGENSNIYVTNSLISMYTKCGSLQNAQDVFNNMKSHTVVSWNALILGYAENGKALIALELFWDMDCEPDALSFVAALKACTCLAQEEKAKLSKASALQKGKDVHAQAVRTCWDSHIFVGSTLVSMYAKCGSMVDAQGVFDKMPRRSVVTWNALLLGYAENGGEYVALDLFARMHSPDSRSFVAVLKACRNLAKTDDGRTRCLCNGVALHSQAASNGCDCDVFVGGMLVAMYARCGSMKDAQKTFDRLYSRNVASWTALIVGYAESGEADLAIQLFACMRREGHSPDARAFAAALKACGCLVFLHLGRTLHRDIRCQGLEHELANSLVDFYGKCGSMVEAQDVFDSLPTRNLETWTSLMMGYSHCGDTQQVLKLFENMTRDESLKPDGVVFLCLLNACAHSGLVGKGKEYLEHMPSKYGINPGIEHYGCMVDLLGRANQLEDALTMAKNMPVPPDETTWTMLLAASSRSKN